MNPQINKEAMKFGTGHSKKLSLRPHKSKWNNQQTNNSHMLSVCSNECHRVLMARFNREVNATSNANPPLASNIPALLASSFPFTDNGQSYHPVNLFSLFHVDSPWRTRTKVYLRGNYWKKIWEDGDFVRVRFFCTSAKYKEHTWICYNSN